MTGCGQQIPRNRSFCWSASGWPSRFAILFLLLLQPLVFPGSNRSANSVHGRNTRYVVQRDGEGWSFISPSGSRFFSFGICCLHPGTSRGEYDPENPSYASWRYYDSADAWWNQSLSRAKDWGFTTLGGWCSSGGGAASRLDATFHQTPVLHIGASSGAPWWDMWDPVNLKRMESVAAEQIRSWSGRPGVIGYYSDNELGWWNGALWKSTLEQRANSGQRKRLIEFLSKTYSNDWSRLMADFNAENCADWNQLRRQGMLYIKPGGDGVQVTRRFLATLAHRYYSLMKSLILKYDPGALYLGDRYQSFYYPEVVLAAAPFVDAISSNLNAHFSDGTFLRCYLDTLHELSSRPVLITEFYMAAAENCSSNMNSFGVFPVVSTQQQRAVAAVKTLSQLMRLPYVIGADWFQYFDEPTHGREDGENFNFGLVDVNDRPYGRLTEALRLQVKSKKSPMAQEQRSNAFKAGIPAAPSAPFRHLSPREALTLWDREQGFIPPATVAPVADLYSCWLPDTLFLGVYCMDIVEAAYYRSANVPKADRALLEILVSGKPLVRARIGAGREPLHSDRRIRIENSSGMNHNVSNISVIEIPSSLITTSQLHPEVPIELEVRLATHAGVRTMQWKGTYFLKAPSAEPLLK